MYTDEVSKAFHDIKPPKDFGVVLVDFDNFISIQIDPKSLVNRLDKDIEEIVQYINDVKKLLESYGNIVNVSREALEDDTNDN